MLRCETVLITPDERVVLGSSDQTMKICSIAENTKVSVFEGHQDGVRCVAVDGNRGVSGSGDMTVKVWNLLDPNAVETLKGHIGPISCVVLTAKYVISASMDSTIRLWNLRNSTEYRSFQHEDGVRCIALVPNTRLLVSGSYDTTVKLWDIENMTKVATFTGHTDRVICLLVTGDGKQVVTGSKDKTVKVWSLENMKEIATFHGHTEEVSCLTVTGKYVISGSWDTTIRIWSLEDMREIATLRSHRNDVTGLAVRPNTTELVSTSRDSQVLVWKLTNIVPALRATFFAESQEPEPVSKPSFYFFGKYVQELQQGDIVSHYVASRTVLPYFFNSLHVCAYFNQFRQLKHYLTHGAPIVRGAFGSALTIALNRNATQCVGEILQHLTTSCKDDSLFIEIQEVTADFLQLLQSRSSHLLPFFQSLLFTPSQTGLPQLLLPLNPLPIVLFRTSRHIQISDFAVSNDSMLWRDCEQQVQFLMSIFRWNFTSGSAESLQFLRALETCPDYRMLITPLVAFVIEQKWKQLLPIAQVHAFLYVSLLVCLSGILFNCGILDLLSIAFIGLNVILLIFKVVQGVSIGNNSGTDWWIYVDLIRGLSSLIWAFFLCFEGLNLQPLRIVVTSLCVLSGFTFFRIFQITRVLYRVTLELLRKTHIFAVVAIYSTCSFCMISATLVPEQVTNVSGIWASVYENVIHNESSGLAQLLCSTTAIFVIGILILTLLASILGEVYKKAQESVNNIDALEMLRLVIEYESLFFWRRGMKESNVLIACEAYQEDITDKWGGRIDQIKAGLETKLKEDWTALEGKIEALEAKLEKVLAALRVPK